MGEKYASKTEKSIKLQEKKNEKREYNKKKISNTYTHKKKHL